MRIVALSSEELYNRVTAETCGIAWVVGSGLSQQVMPGVQAMLELIASEWQSQGQSRADAFLAGLPTSGNKYQAAFDTLIRNCGPETANRVIRRAVINARLDPASRHEAVLSGQEVQCSSLEADEAGWNLSPGHQALGEIITASANTHIVLTTNFDPLIEVAIKRARGRYAQVFLSRDGALGAFKSDAPLVVHLHGYWFGGNTLHTPDLLTAPRPALQASLRRLLEKRLVVVLGYAGWDDVLMTALGDLATDPNSSLEVRWAFHEADPAVVEDRYAGPLKRLAPALQHQAFLHLGVDAHALLQRIVLRLPPAASCNGMASRHDRPSSPDLATKARSSSGTLLPDSVSSNRIVHTDQTGDLLLERLFPANAYGVDSDEPHGDSASISMVLHFPANRYLTTPVSIMTFTPVAALCVARPGAFLAALRAVIGSEASMLSTPPADMLGNDRLQLANAIRATLVDGFALAIALPRSQLEALSANVRVSYQVLTSALLVPLLNAHRRRGAAQIHVRISQAGSRDKSLLQVSKASVSATFPRKGTTDFAGRSDDWSEPLGQVARFVGWAVARHYNNNDDVYLNALRPVVR